MKKNKGFTLIELLAVLVILAIIALIITPIVTNLIKDSRIKAAENAANGLFDAVEVFYGRVILKSDGTFNNNGIVYVTFGSNGTITYDPNNLGVEIEYNGTKVTDGKITIFRNGNYDITKALRINGYYCAWKNAESDRTIKCDESSSNVSTDSEPV